MKKQFKYNRTSRPTGLTKDRARLYNSRVIHALKWIIRTYGIDPNILEPSLKYVSFLEHLSKYKGLEYSLQVNKFTRLQVTRYLSGFPIKVGPVTHGGVPKKLKGLVPYIHGRKELRFILTVLFVTRRITLPLRPDISSIIGDYEGSSLTEFFKYIPGFVKSLKKLWVNSNREKEFKIPEWKEYHLSTKKGPSGKQALLSCLSDLANLPVQLKRSIALVGGPYLESKMNLLYPHIFEFQELFDQPIELNKPIRKISSVPDSEGKTRVVAIGDYWTQTCLKPLHDFLNRVLRCIPQDQTFNQGEGLRDLPFDRDMTYHCYDLTAATDRFPIKLIGNIISVLADSDSYSKAWIDIMVNYPFTYIDPKGERLELFYKVGNPMGFYSSWVSFAISHHFIIYVCCRKLRKSWFKCKYKLLGDDIVIMDKDVAILYRDIMIKSLGVKISEQKTHVSSCFCEFAKRYFVPEGEITPISIKALIAESKSYYALRQFMHLSRDKGWVPVGSSLHALNDFYSHYPYNKLRRNSKLKRFNKISRTNALFNRMNGFITDLGLVNIVLVTDNRPILSCNQEYQAKALFEGCIVRTFEKSASSFQGDMQDRVFNALLHFSSISEEMVEVLYAHPFAFIQGFFIEETYIKTMNKAYDFDTLYGGHWLPYFRVLKVSDATNIFSNRSHVIIASVAPLLLKGLDDVIKERDLYP